MQTDFDQDLTATLPQARISRERYDRMVAAGIFGEDDRIELLNGVLVTMSPQDHRHAEAIQELNEILVRLFSGEAKVRVQLPFATDEFGEPEPDLALIPLPVVRGEHPSRALLVVEVADSSLRKDRLVKGAIYARAQVPEYWIVDVAHRVVEVYREPLGDHYAQSFVARPGESVAIQALPGAMVAVAAIFGE